MLDALEGWLDDGGRLMYLGGNGFYWVTSLIPTEPHVLEVRRGHAGTRVWALGAGRGASRLDRRARRALAVPRPASAAAGRRRLRGPGLRRVAALPPRRPAAATRASRGSSRVSAEGEFGAHGSVLGGAGRVRARPRSTPRSGRRRTRSCSPSRAGSATSTRASWRTSARPTRSRAAPSRRYVRSRHRVLRDADRRRGLLGRARSPGAARSTTTATTTHVSRITENVLRRFADPAPFAQPEEA